MKLKFLLIGTSLSLIPQYATAQCAVTDCQQLGYTLLKSCDGGLKCPFGEYWACPKVEEKAVLGACTGYAKNCKIADILNSDGTCTTDKESGKTPLGVVIYIGSDNCGYAMTASPIATSIQWGGYGTDILSLPNYSLQDAINDFDVGGNMTKIIQAGNASTYPAAYAAFNYAPSAAPTTKGKWMLPTLGILNSLYPNLYAIDNTILKLGGTLLTVDERSIWSSSEYDKNYAYFFYEGNGLAPGSAGISGKNLSSEMIVRPVIAF
mgnify:CR=1 FL=1